MWVSQHGGAIDMGFVIFLIAMGVGLLGGFFIAATAFKKFFKASNATYLQLLAFTAMFSVSFVALIAAIGWLTRDAVPFGR